MHKNIFSLKRKQDEPYLTQIFSYLLEFDSAFCKKFISEVLEVKFDEIIGIKPEASMENGQPDMIINFSGNKTIAIENKISANFTLNQIENYLKNENVEAVYLIYKTISDVNQARLAKKAISWSEVFLFAKKYLASIKDETTIEYFLFQNFCSYLKQEGLAMERVTWEILKGIEALQNLINQIRCTLEAFKEKKEVLGVKNVSNSTSTYTGWEVILDKEEKFYVYLLYHPTIIFSYFCDKGEWAENYELINQKIPTLDYWDDSHWHLKSFELEKNHYLSSPVEDQMSIIKDFISRSIKRYNEE
jgi:hypothetical protein